ncbi:glycosyltransferase [Pedobacter sp. MW01-1-1]|uniref:glycosyltransferase n=1 Tax=Pedobacter sp. MW01-1-1 TaxID=3383027 RepID=UPI003FEF8DB4
MRSKLEPTFKKLKIVITADPEIPVPPEFYGGIERIIDMLINEYIYLGHEVTLFAHEKSITRAKLYPYPGKTNGRIDFLKNMLYINNIVFRQNYDIIHSFGRLAYLTPSLPLKIPKLMSYQREPTINQIIKALKIAKKSTLMFTGCSNYISNKIKPIAITETVYNGVDSKKYYFTAEVELKAPLIFLGRVEPIKGPDIAIRIAQQTNKSLIIAGNLNLEHEDYFNESIKPYLNDQIKYVGPVNDQQKNELLSKSSALLMPIIWDEPFGIVMVEAMACGTPVIAFNRGAAPEVVSHGVSGFRGNTFDDLVFYVTQIPTLSRQQVNTYFLENYSSSVISQRYLNIYQKLINKTNAN